jgi:hypothetical protein
MWAFAVPVLLIALFPDSLLACALYSLGLNGVLVFLTTPVVSWIDRADRLRVFTTAVWGQNLLIVINCALLLSILAFNRNATEACEAAAAAAAAASSSSSSSSSSSGSGGDGSIQEANASGGGSGGADGAGSGSDSSSGSSSGSGDCTVVATASDRTVLLLLMMMVGTGVAAELGASLATTCIEKDWVVVMAGRGNSLLLAQINITLRRIDLVCK